MSATLVETAEYLGTATYSPDDNKLRFTPFARLSKEDYEKVKAAGFAWAPRQQIFVAGMWTPSRADLLTEICGEIGDEDTTLVERAEERAERFGDYKASRLRDAESADRAVHAIADNIPLGQPILVGHHSEKHARKDAERIDNGMRRACKMWETAQYWQDRAEGARSHARHQDRADVRYRRIRTIEADKRKQETTRKECEARNKLWDKVGSREQALAVANYDHISACFPIDKYPRPEGASQYEGAMGFWSALSDDILGWEEARERSIRCHVRTIARVERWIEHHTFRLEYERAMLDEQGGIATSPTDYEVGGTINACGTRCTILKINRGASGDIVSVSTNNRSWPRVVSVEKINEYEPPTEEAQAAAKARNKLPPLVNYNGEGLSRMNAQKSAEGVK